MDLTTMLAARAALMRRVHATVTVIVNVTRKHRFEDVPPELRGLRNHVDKAVAFDDTTMHVPTPTGVARLPLTLLSFNDRQVATWTRQRIREYRAQSIERERTRLRIEVADDEMRLARMSSSVSAKRHRLSELDALAQSG